MDEQLLISLHTRVELLEHKVSDHAQRFDTLQTPAVETPRLQTRRLAGA